jgi:hypothetical protein
MMGRYGGMVKEIEALVRALKASGELDRILNEHPTETWRDVTGEMDGPHSDGKREYWDHASIWGHVISLAGNSPYRLRKVHVYRDGRERFEGDAMIHMHAFIIEKRDA